MNPDRIEALSRSLADPTSRRGMLRLLGVGVAGTAITAVGLTEAQAERKRGRNVRAQTTAAAVAPIPITGTGADGSLFAGLFTLTRFASWARCTSNFSGS